MIFFIIIVLGLLASLILQEFIPPLPWLYGARVFIMPVVLFYGALAFPFGGMLLLAFLSGFMWDALTAQVMDETYVELSLGWSIILYAALGAIMSGFRPLFLRGRWEIHCLVSGVCTSIIVFTEFLMITFRRGGFSFPVEVWWRVGGAGLITLILSPLIFLLLNSVARMVGYNVQPERKPIR